jgi:trk system potassium uptake protein TrkH
MAGFLSRRPLFVLLMGLGAVVMIVPAIHARVVEDYDSMRIFFYGFLLFSVMTLFVALATVGHQPRYGLRGLLVSLLAGFVFLPIMLAIPFVEAVPHARLFDGWFEMVSGFTTTGATLWDDPRNLPRSVHLWRALVGWMGGLLMWIAAMAVLLPLNLGGFEVYQQGTARAGQARQAQIDRSIAPPERLARYILRFVPIYTGLTLLLWLGLTMAGEVPFVALCHAMATLSTSGISPVGGLYYSASGVAGEVMIALFLVFALSHLTFSRAPGEDPRTVLTRDPELRFGLSLVGLLSAALFARHVVELGGEGVDNSLSTALAAAWGGLFTILSFMTTAGFESTGWEVAQDWSGLSSPGLMLVGLTVVGGGVATTAGGIKLLRVYALYKHSQRELDRLVHPSSVGGAGAQARRIRTQGAQIAWVFFMIFALSIAGVMVLLSLTGVQFETALVLAVSALSTTGPLAVVGAEDPISYAGLTDLSRIVLAFAMILGRLEALAIIALLNPEFWRR